MEKGGKAVLVIFAHFPGKGITFRISDNTLKQRESNKKYKETYSCIHVISATPAATLII